MSGGFGADHRPDRRAKEGEAGRPEHPFLVQVDHIGIEVPDPAAVVRFFADDLGLPEVFPFTRFPGYATGSVALGNAYLEILRFGRSAAGAGASRFRILGFLVPPGSLPGAAVELDGRSVGRSAVVPYYVPASLVEEPTVAWENVFLGDLLDGGAATRLFFAATRLLRTGPAAQHSPLAATLTPLLLRRAFPQGMVLLTDYRLVNDDRKRAADWEALRSRGGGALGLRVAAEVVIDASAVGAQAWHRLLAPLAPSADGLWTVGAGPAVRLVPSASGRIAGLRLRVESVLAAERRLHALGVPTTASALGLAFSPPGAPGVVIDLLEGGP